MEISIARQPLKGIAKLRTTTLDGRATEDETIELYMPSEIVIGEKVMLIKNSESVLCDIRTVIIDALVHEIVHSVLNHEIDIETSNLLDNIALCLSD